MNQITKKYDLEDRTLDFSKMVIRFCRDLEKNVITIELIKQVVRSSASVGANYREANEKLGKKDFIHRLRISRKEAKETTYWLELILEAVPKKESEIKILIQEVQELRNILSSIIAKSEK